MSSTIRIVFYGIYQIRNLVDAFIVPVTPLGAVDRTEVAVFVSPLIPDSYFIIVQIFDVGIAIDKP